MDIETYNKLIEEATSMGLQPCPFCGSDLVGLRSICRLHFVNCQSCGARGPWNQDTLDTYEAPKLAVDRWNNWNSDGKTVQTYGHYES